MVEHVTMILQPQEFYSKHAQDHAEKHTIDDIPEEFMDLLDTFIEESPGPRVLDAGCGAGRDTAYFAENELDPVGIDISPEMIEYASTNHPGEYVVMDFRDLAFSSEEFDSIWAPASVFFQSPVEMSAALKEFYRVLVPGGIGRIGFKIGNGETVKHEWGDSVTQHLVGDEAATTLLRDAGFTVQDKRLMRPVPSKTFVNFRVKK